MEVNPTVVREKGLASLPAPQEAVVVLDGLLDALVTGGVLDFNPALSVKAPRQSVGQDTNPDRRRSR
jgi:hypothetical protein